MFARLRNAYLVATAPIPDLKIHATRLVKCVVIAAQHLAAGERGAEKLEYLAAVRRMVEIARGVQDRMQAAQLAEIRDALIRPVAPSSTGDVLKDKLQEAINFAKATGQGSDGGAN